MAEFDLILVGGGLANGIIAGALRERRPEIRLLIVEAGAKLGGNHTWSFHSSDLTVGQDKWLERIVHRSWRTQEVIFPRLRRKLPTGYRSIRSEDLHEWISGLGGIDIARSTRVTGLEADGVVVEGGQRISAGCVIDGRGSGPCEGLALGFQKFVGLEVELKEPHGLAHPIIMDARVAQHDGYRFVYCLPFSTTRVLIEDTYYADEPELDAALLERRTRAYADAAGWQIARVERDEAGVLPIVLDGPLDAIWPAAEASRARAGMRAGLFHQTTGYSLPLAVQAAELIADLRELSTQAVGEAVRSLSAQVWSRQSYYRLLNRMLFLAARPYQRRDVMERFYGLAAPLIERFYAGRLTAFDKARILSGRPPVSVIRALGALAPGAADGHRRLAG